MVHDSQRTNLDAALAPTKVDIAALKDRLSVLQWAIGLNILLTLAVLAKVLTL